MTESDYENLPSWMKSNMLPCICGGKTVLSYLENEEYKVECIECQRIALFKAKSMVDAKEHWKTHPHCITERRIAWKN